MAKFLLWAVVIAAVLLVSRLLNQHKARGNDVRGLGQSAGNPGPASNAMVRCAHCHIYLPRAEAYMSQGKTWCSAEHARLGLRK